MAWNEPGNQKDPWGKRPSDSPDLDEAINELKTRFGAFFGRRPKRSADGGKARRSPPGRLVGLALIILLVVFVLSGFYVIDAGWHGVVLRFGAYHTTTSPGLHWAFPLMDDVLPVNTAQVRILEIGYRTGGGAVPREGLMLTRDENIIDVRLAVQYQVSDARKFLFKVKNPYNAPDETIKQVTESALREVVGKQEMDFIIARGRATVSDRTAELIQGTLDQYDSGVQIRSINFQEVQPPGYVQAAFDDAVKSREDKERFINEANAYRNEVLPRAKGESARVLEDAVGYRARVIAEAEGDASRFAALLAEYRKAPAVTRQRLYIDAIEQVMQSTGKVLIDTDSGNNLLMLPLEQLFQQGGRARIQAATATPGPVVGASTDTDKQEVPPSNSRQPRRETRQREVK